MKKSILAACAIPLLLAGAASAATELVSSAPISPQTTDWTNSLSFTQFDPSLGTLTSVTVKLSGSISTVITVTNGAADPSSGTAKTEVLMTVQDPGNNLSGVGPLPSNPTLDILTPIYSYSLSAGGSSTSGTIPGSAPSSVVYSSAPVLAEFTGLGTMSLTATTFTQTVLANTGGNTTAGQVTTAGLTASVIYTYTAPEPAALSLLGIGMGAMVLRRRRSR